MWLMWLFYVVVEVVVVAALDFVVVLHVAVNFVFGVVVIVLLLHCCMLLLALG